MKAAIAELLTVFILIIYLFQPALDNLYRDKNYLAELAMDKATQEAAVEGYYTPAIISELKATLTTGAFFKNSDIQFTGTQMPVQRGQYLEGTLTVPAGPMFILYNMFGTQNYPKNIVKHGQIMSEYIP